MEQSQTTNWTTEEQCLNPYYNGRYSWRPFANIFRDKKSKVLILIIMEDTHGVDRSREVKYR